MFQRNISLQSVELKSKFKKKATTAGGNLGLVYSSTLKIESKYSSETSGCLNTTSRYKPEGVFRSPPRDCEFLTARRNNPKSSFPTPEQITNTVLK
jgi:hypothetical protein